MPPNQSFRPPWNSALSPSRRVWNTGNTDLGSMFFYCSFSFENTIYPKYESPTIDYILQFSLAISTFAHNHQSVYLIISLCRCYGHIVCSKKNAFSNIPYYLLSYKQIIKRAANISSCRVIYVICLCKYLSAIFFNRDSTKVLIHLRQMDITAMK